MNYYLILLIILLLIIGILFDFLSVFYKTAENNNITGKLLSSAALTQFYSRVCYMIAAFITVFFREQYFIYLNFIQLVITGITFALIIILLSIKYKNILSIIFFIPNLLIEKIHNYKFNFYNKTEFSIKIERIIFLSYIINILIFLALLSPFLIIEYYPNLAMTSVYSSQGINFISNLILLTFYDPIVNNFIDIKDSTLRWKIISGKILSYITIILIYVAL